MNQRGINPQKGAHSDCNTTQHSMTTNSELKGTIPRDVPT